MNETFFRNRGAFIGLGVLAAVTTPVVTDDEDGNGTTCVHDEPVSVSIDTTPSPIS